MYVVTPISIRYYMCQDLIVPGENYFEERLLYRLKKWTVVKRKSLNVCLDYNFNKKITTNKMWSEVIITIIGQGSFHK